MALEMAGVQVVAEPEQLDRVDAAAAQKIYEEVSYDPSRLDSLLVRLD